MRKTVTPDGAYGEPGAWPTGTPGSGGGSGKRTGRKADTAPRADLTVLSEQCRLEVGLMPET